MTLARTLGTLLLAGAALAACAAPPGLNDVGSGEQASSQSPAVRGGRDGGASASPESAGAGDFLEPRRLELGEVGDGDTVTIDVGDGDVGFVVTAVGSRELGVVKVTSPSGRVVFDDFTRVGTTQPTGGAQNGVASISVPSAAEAARAIERGPWTITFAGTGVSTANARVQVADGGAFAGAALDLHVWVPDGLRIEDPSPPHRVVASRAASDPDHRARVDAFFEVLTAVTGIDRGAVAFHAAPAELRTLDDEAKLARAGALPEDEASSQALHVVLTNDILHGAAMGLSPGMPGAVGLAGTASSAIFAAHLDGVSARIDATTWLHEMGHFVGLHHTSELDGTIFDPLPDTPRCEGKRTETTRCPDDGNLMFTGAFAPVPRLSPSQLAVFRTSPLARAKRAKR